MRLVLTGLASGAVWFLAVACRSMPRCSKRRRRAQEVELDAFLACPEDHADEATRWALERAQASSAVDLDQVSKTFNVSGQSPVQALQRLSLGIKAGETFGLLGPNGAGKTTCMRIISGELSADDGAVLVSDQEVDGVADARSAVVAHCPQHDAVPAYLTGREATELFARLEGLREPVKSASKALATV